MAGKGPVFERGASSMRILQELDRNALGEAAFAMTRFDDAGAGQQGQFSFKAIGSDDATPGAAMAAPLVSESTLATVASAKSAPVASVQDEGSFIAQTGATSSTGGSAIAADGAAASEGQPVAAKDLQANETLTVTQTTVLAPGGDTDGDGVIDPGETVITTVTITNNSTNTAATGVSFSETLAGMTLSGTVNASPLAINDTYSAVGNTLLEVGNATSQTGPQSSVAGSVFDNDREFLGDTFSLSSFSATSANGGSVSMTADGSFTYVSAAGFTGADTFTYTIRDKGLDGIAGNADDLTSTATVTVNVANTVWYIDTLAVSNGNGTSTNPFNTIANVNGAGGAGDADSAGSILYVRGDLTANIVLESGQSLIGTGSALVVDGNTLAAAGTLNTFTHGTGIGVLLSTGNTLRGFRVDGNNTAGTGIADGNGTVGNLTISNVDITGNGQAIDIDQGGTLAVALGTVTSTFSTSNGVHLQGVSGTFTASSGVIANSSGVGFLIGAAGGVTATSGGNATISYGGAISEAGGAAVEIQDRTGGTVTFSGGITETAGSGIVADGNAGTINFTGQIALTTGSADAIVLTNNSAAMNFTPGGNGLDITTATGRGFIVDGGGGTVTLTGSGNTVATGSGRAVEIDNVTIGASGVTFLRVGISNGSSTTGIFLNNAGSGGFTITGSGSTAGSGGTISSIDGGADGNVEQGIGIYINNTNNISLSNLNISGDFANFGIRGVNVNNFTLRDSQLNAAATDDGGFGDNNATDEGAISFTGLTGTALFEGNNLSDGHEDVLVIDNSSGTLSLTIRDSANDAAVIGRNGTTTGNDGILVNTSGTASVTALIEGVEFTGSRGDMIQFNASGSATQNITIRNNTMHNTHPDVVSGGGGVSITGGAGTGAGYNVTYRIEGNSIRGAEGTALFLNHLGDAGTVNGVIVNNTIGNNNGAYSDVQADTGANNGGNGIFIGLEHGTGGGNLTHAVTIQGNNIGDIRDGAGIFLRSNGDTVAGNGTTRLEATIRNNVIDEMGPNSLAGIYAQVGGTGSNDDGLLGLNIENNNINLTGATNSAATMVFDDLAGNAQFYFPGYAGPYDDNGLRTFHSGPEGNTLVHPLGTAAHVITSPTGTFATGNAFVLSVPVAAAPLTKEDWEATLRAQQQLAQDDHLAALIADEASLKALAAALAAQSLGVAATNAAAADGSGDPTLYAGETISVNIGSLPNGRSVTIQWRATIDAQSNGLIVNPVNTGTVSVTGGGFPATTPTNTVTTNVDTLTLGGTVFNDNGAGGGVFRNGVRDGTEGGYDGLTVALFVDANNDNVADSATPLLTTTTAGGGNYSFAGLAPGNYIVRVTSGTLFSSPGTVDPDNNVDNDDNGSLSGGFVVSNAITLAYNSEPTAGTGNDTNNTLDFALSANQPPAANDDSVTVAEDSGANDVTSLLLANDTDPENDTRTIIAVTQGSFGTVSLVGGVVTYTPNANYNGTDSFTYTLSDGNGNTDTATANITVTAVNDPVTGTAPATLSVAEDTNTAVTGMSISDVDAARNPSGVYEVTLSATNGTLTLTTLTGLTFTVGDSSSDATMTFHGTLADLNTALGTARYLPNSNYSGTAQIQLQVTDTFGGVVATGTGAATSDSDTIAVTVNAVNDAPVLDLNGAPAGTDNAITLSEQASDLIAPNAIVSDVDSANFDTGTLTVTYGAAFRPEDGFGIRDEGGRFSNAGGNRLGVEFNNVYYNTVLIGTFTNAPGQPLVVTFNANATPAAVQRLVQSVIAYNFSDTPPSGQRSATVTLTDGDGASSSAQVGVTITAVNDAPTSSGPASQAGTEDANLVFSTANGNAITVGDVDNGTVTVTLAVSNGTLTLSQTTGLTFGTGDGSADATMTFTGTLANINAALNGLTYRGNLNYEGSDALTVNVTDGAASAPQRTVAITLADDGRINGDPGNNALGGTPQNDFFDLRQGGNDTVSGQNGDDAFYFGSAYTSADSVDGGAGALDQIGLQGNYAGGVTLGSITGVELIVLLPGDDTRFGDTAGNFYDYSITAPDSAVAAGGLLIIQANTLRAGEDFTFNGSAETNGRFLTYGGFGTETLTGGAGDDGFFFGQGRFGASDTVNGGGGSMDQLGLQGNFAGAGAVTFGASQLTSVEFIVLLSASDTRFGAAGGTVAYDLTMNNGNVAAGQRMIIQANTLLAGEILTFNGAAETDGAFQIFSGRGNDVLRGSQGADDVWANGGADRITGNGGADTLRGGAGNDTFLYNLASDSTSAARDSILDFATGDLIDFAGLVSNTGGGGYSFVGGNAQSGARQVQVIQTGSAATVNVFVDGDNVADLVINVTVADGHTLTSADFSGLNAAPPQSPLKAAGVDAALAMGAAPDAALLGGAKGGHLDASEHLLMSSPESFAVADLLTNDFNY